MPDLSPAETITAAAQQLRAHGDHRLANELIRPIADWLDVTAVYCHPGEHQPQHVHRALAVARALLGGA